MSNFGIDSSHLLIIAVQTVKSLFSGRVEANSYIIEY